MRDASPALREGRCRRSTQAFETIGMAKVAKSAAEAKEIGFLRATDGITMNRDRLLADAKARRLELADDYSRRRCRASSACPARAAARALELAVDGFVQSGKATPHDVVVSVALAEVLTGGRTDITRDADRGRDARSWSAPEFHANLSAARRPWPGSSTCSTPASRCGIDAVRGPPCGGHLGVWEKETRLRVPSS